MSYPIITNAALVSRFDHLAVPMDAVIDGSLFTVDTQLLRGTVLVLNTSTGLYHAFGSADVTAGLAVDKFLILCDPVFVQAGVSAPVPAFYEGFFVEQTILDANPLLTNTILAAVASAHILPTGEVRIK